MRSKQLRSGSSYRLVSAFVLLSLAHVSAAGAALEFAAKDDVVRVEGQHIDVTIDPPQRRGQPLKARTKISYRLVNGADKPRRALRKVPVMTSPSRQPAKEWFRVRLNDQAVEATEQQLVDSKAQTPTEEQLEAWTRTLEEWARQDKELQKLLARFRELDSVRDDLNRLSEEFNTEIVKHLVHARECRFAALSVANGDKQFGYLVKLMPEVDPSLRLDVEYQRWKYVSYLNDLDPESYRPYEAEWRRKAEEWFQSKPKLAELVPQLRRAWESHRQAQKLLNGEILKHLHDWSGLSLPLAIELRDYYGSRYPALPENAVRALFPEVRQELDTAAKQQSDRLQKHGFDGAALGPYTGELYLAGDDSWRRRYDDWRDPTVVKALGSRADRPTIRIRSRASRGQQSLSWPALMTFTVPLKAAGKTMVSIEQETHVLPLPDPRSSVARLGTPTDQSCVIRPEMDTAPSDVRVSVPPGYHPVISPAPQSVTTEKDGRRIFATRISRRGENVHLLLMNLGILETLPKTTRTLQDLDQLLELTENRTVQPLLLTARYSVLLELRQWWDAHRTLLQLRMEFPEFTGPNARTQIWSREAEQLYEWIEQKGRAPHFETQEDLNRFRKRAANDSYVLNAQALDVLARKVQMLDEVNRSIEERMGRWFVLCQAGVEPRRNLAELLTLANSDPQAVLPALKLIGALTIEKSEAVPFVLKQTDSRLREKGLKPSNPAWIRHNAAYSALRTFRSPAAAKQLIAFIRSTEDALLIQGAVDALAKMTLPKLFDDLAGIADRVAGSAEGPFLQYLRLMVRSDRDRAVKLLRQLAEKHPRYAARITGVLAEAGERDVLPAAIRIYQTSQDRRELSITIQTLRTLCEPADIAQLKYRRGLQDWMNESLVSILGEKGGDRRAFPFVQQYYFEFVRGKKTRNLPTCVGAFEAVGDKRAIPHLREIVQTAERKDYVARAIGSLLLDRRVKRTTRPTSPEISQLVHAVAEPRVSAERKTAAWKQLLKDRDASMQQILRSSVRYRLQQTNWRPFTPEEAERWAYLSRFGDVAARHLLDASLDASLIGRYHIAQLLALLPEKSKGLLRAAAVDSAGDMDQRRTAILALRMNPDQASVSLLAELLDDEALRMNVIDALASIASPDAVAELKRLKRRLDRETTGFRRKAWLLKVETALTGTRS